MIVLDSSALIELLLATPRGRRIAQRISSDAVQLNAPHLIDIEVAQVLRRYVRHKVLTAERARLALDHLLDLDLHRYAHDQLIDRIWVLRDNFTAYDAAYLALAEALETTLLTTDQKLANAPKLPVEVEVF